MCTGCSRRAPFSFDYLVGAQHYRRRYGKAERGGGLAVHGHFELGRELHREIARLLAAQDAIDISGGATPVVFLVDSLGEQTAVLARRRTLNGIKSLGQNARFLATNWTQLGRAEKERILVRPSASR
jgi:hypothetical protein